MSTSRLIVVEGPIGVGKTTLARRLAQTFGCEPLLEHAAENPFLEKFYRNPGASALPVQLYFLLQRARQIQDWRQYDLFARVRIADFLLDKDRLFARLTMDEDEYRLYETVYQSLAIDAPQPDLVVSLQAPMPVLLERINRRGIAYEQQIDINYLQGVVDAYTQFFYYFDEAPLLIVNTAEIDLVNNDQDYQLLLDQIMHIKSGRHYFNPIPAGF
ncbi:MAG: deoxynucleoside kinase [Gammaproteobacteria bacterium]|nr:deoxynucleoside kinase [Gammaproteobacteria bacterium]